MMTKHAPSQHWIELLFDALLALLIALAIAAAQPVHAVESTSLKLGDVIFAARGVNPSDPAFGYDFHGLRSGLRFEHERTTQIE